MRPDPDDAPDLEEDSGFLFAEEDAAPATAPKSGKPWKMLVVDDNEDIHNISNIVLRDCHFEGRPLAIRSAYSGKEAMRMMEEQPDTAVMLLDVVMETDNAGLDVVHYVRNTLKNSFVRIILRTGQPGQAPERSVVVDYDINDYKEKTELTSQKLVTTVITALRGYRDLQIIDNSRRGLEQIIASSRNLFEPQSLKQFSAGVLQQMTALLNLGEDSLYVHSGFTAKHENQDKAEDFLILAGTGQYANSVNHRLDEVVDPEIKKRLQLARAEKRNVIDSEYFVGYFRTANGSENLVFLQTRHPLSEFDANLLQVFAVNVGIAFDNVYLNEDIHDSQNEIICVLGEVVESHGQDNSRHVFRVGAYARLLGQLLGLDNLDCKRLQMVAPMHDIGNIRIRDELLNKPGSYSTEEFEQMKQHTILGYQIFRAAPPAQQAPLQSAALIAAQHHEWWNGSGYPKGLSGEDIHIYGRIIALADVFDALSQKRSHRPAWPVEQAVDYIRTRSGTQFDPKIVEAFLNNLDAFLAIMQSNPDAPEAAPPA